MVVVGLLLFEFNDDSFRTKVQNDSMKQHGDGIGMMLILCTVFSLSSTNSLAEDTQEEPRLPLGMEVFLKKPQPQEYVLHVHVTNLSEDSVTVYVHEFPWVPPNDGKWLKAMRQHGSGAALQQRFPLGKVGSRPVKLLPGESVQDTIALNPRMPTLLEDIRRYGVRLHWECPPPGLKFVCSPGSSQVIAIPKGDLGEPDVYAIDRQACQKREKVIRLVNIPKDHEVLFVEATPSIVKDFQKIHALLFQISDYVQNCHPGWTNSWGVSFFTDRQYAGFLRDEKSRLLFEKGEWQHANIGQYSSQIRTLFRFPWIKKQSDSVYLSVYR